MNVFLVGFMGSGKSTLGRLLAKQLHFTFIETDVLIEESEKLTINEIFKTKGEEYFRNKETEILHHLKLVDNCVIATGGGMPCFNNNMELINKSGTSVWLDVSEKELEKRLHNNSFFGNDRSKRPKLAEFGSLQQAIATLLEERKAFYAMANIRLADPALE